MHMPFNWPTLSLREAKNASPPDEAVHEALDPYFLGVFAEHALADRRALDRQGRGGERLAGPGLSGAELPRTSP